MREGWKIGESVCSKHGKPLIVRALHTPHNAQWVQSMPSRCRVVPPAKGMEGQE